MRQWMLKITAYADRLLEDLEELDWPDGIKAMRRIVPIGDISPGSLDHPVG